LLHQVEQRRDAPVVGDLAIDDPDGVDGVETDFLPVAGIPRNSSWWVPSFDQARN